MVEMVATLAAVVGGGLRSLDTVMVTVPVPVVCMVAPVELKVPPDPNAIFPFTSVMDEVESMVRSPCWAATWMAPEVEERAVLFWMMTLDGATELLSVKKNPATESVPE